VDSIRVASRVNSDLIAAGRVFLRQGAVSDLPYESGHFDVALATESHYFWPDLPADLAEVLRVLRAGGKLLLGDAAYLGGRFDGLIRWFATAGGMNCQALSELEKTVARVGYNDVASGENWHKGWFCVVGTKPAGGCDTASPAT